MKGRTCRISSSLLLTLSKHLENTVKPTDMSTSPAAASSLMLSLSEFTHLMGEQHYHFLSQSLYDLERQVKRHRVEQYIMELNLANF